MTTVHWLKNKLPQCANRHKDFFLPNPDNISLSSFLSVSLVPCLLSAFISLWWICCWWWGSVASKCLTKEQIAGYFLATFWSLCQDRVSGVELRAGASGRVSANTVERKGSACLCGVRLVFVLLHMFVMLLSLSHCVCVCVCVCVCKCLTVFAAVWLSIYPHILCHLSHPLHDAQPHFLLSLSPWLPGYCLRTLPTAPTEPHMLRHLQWPSVFTRLCSKTPFLDG